MATPRSQRIGIWIIAIVMIVGTLGSFLVMGLSQSNQRIDQENQQKQQQEYMKTLAKMNADNSEPFGDYTTNTFDPKSVTELKVEVLKEGTGEVVKATDSINSSYFGWLSDGKVFDSSKKKSANDTPLTFSLSNVITGWTEGLTGLKVGSVVRLIIPSDKAYGDREQGNIPPNSPMEFIVEIHKIDNKPQEGTN